LFLKKWISQSKQFFDELCTDQPLADPENNFKINVFYTNMDIIISQLRTRFMDMNNIVNKFKFIFPKNLVLYIIQFRTDPFC